MDIPVDGDDHGGLFVQKIPRARLLKWATWVDYSITISNKTGYALDQSDVPLTGYNRLPAFICFRQRPIDGKPVTIQKVAQDRACRSTWPHEARSAVARHLSCPRRPGAMQGDGVNRVVASYRRAADNAIFGTTSLPPKCKIVGGHLRNAPTSRAKAFADCDKDGLQGRNKDTKAHELAFPVCGCPRRRHRCHYATTDAEGKFSFYGLFAHPCSEN